MATLDTTVYDADQIKMMEERCILLDNNDNIIGSDTKKNCHLLDKIKKHFFIELFLSFYLEQMVVYYFKKDLQKKLRFLLIGQIHAAVIPCMIYQASKMVQMVL